MTVCHFLSRTAGVSAAALSATLLIAGEAGASTPPAPTALPTPTAPSAAAAACDAGAWGLRVQGAPKNFSGGDRSGDYLWHDKTGFHLRVTHKGDQRALYTGEIVSPTPLRIDPVKLEKGDTARLSADHKTLYFEFADYGYVDGVNFHTDCASMITIKNLTVGNALVPADRVYFGAHELHPSALPVTIHRSDNH